MSQETLARLALTSTRTIARIEGREVAPRPATLLRICIALGVSPDFFSEWTQDRPAYSIRAAKLRNARKREFAARQEAAGVIA